MLRFVDYVSSTCCPSSLHSLLTSRVSYEGESIQSTSPGWQAVCCFFLPLIGYWTRIFSFSEFDFDGTDMKKLTCLIPTYFLKSYVTHTIRNFVEKSPTTSSTTSFKLMRTCNRTVNTYMPKLFPLCKVLGPESLVCLLRCARFMPQ